MFCMIDIVARLDTLIVCKAARSCGDLHAHLMRMCKECVSGMSLRYLQLSSCRQRRKI